MNAAARISRLVSRRIQYLARVQELAAEGFELAPSARYVVRRADVAGYVARGLGIDASPALYQALLAATKALGWEPTKSHNRSLYRRVKVRGMSDERALELSQQLRRRPGSGE